MDYYAIYNTTDGIIRQIVFSTEAGAALQLAADEDYILGGHGEIDDMSHYISGSPPAFTAKTDLTTTINKTSIADDGVDEAIISSVPNGTHYHIENDVFSYWANGTITDGTLEFSTLDIGTYVITLLHVEHLKKTYTVTAA